MKKNRTKIFVMSLTAVVFLMICALLWWGRASDDGQHPPPDLAAKNRDFMHEKKPNPADSAKNSAAVSAETPPYLIDINASGHVQLSTATRAVFDYFLGERGAINAANIARAQRYFREQLAEPAASETAQAFTAYVNYRQALAALNAVSTVNAASAANGERVVNTGNTGNTDRASAPEHQPANNPLAAAAALQQQSALRAQHLSAEMIQAFFGDEDAVARYALARSQISRIRGLSPEQKTEQLDALRQQLPVSAQKKLARPLWLPENQP